MNAVRIDNPRRQIFLQQFGNERARNERTLVDIKTKWAKPGLVGEIGGGDTLDGAALDDALDRG